MKKRSLIALLLCAVVLLTCGCSAKAKTFNTNGLTIELTEAFKETERYDDSVVYKSKNIEILVERYEFENISQYELTLDAYAYRMVNYAPGIYEKVLYEGDLPYHLSTREVNGESINYTKFFYKSEDAYWMVQFTCESDQYEDLKDAIFGYAATVKV